MSSSSHSSIEDHDDDYAAAKARPHTLPASWIRQSEAHTTSRPSRVPRKRNAGESRRALPTAPLNPGPLAWIKGGDAAAFSSRRLILVLGGLMAFTALLRIVPRLWGSHWFHGNDSLIVSSRANSAGFRHGTTSQPPVVTEGGEDIFKAIPNVVHFVAVGNMTLNFIQWLAVEAADQHLRPEAIFMHVAPNTTITGKYADKLLTKPNFHVKSARDPIPTTLNGKPIVYWAHVADLLRVDALIEYGGIYMDLDAIALRDMSKLRQAGFANVLGVESGGSIAFGLILAQPQSMLFRDLQREMRRVYDGSWSKHSVQLLTRLARSHHAPESLVLAQDAFFPYAWWHNDLVALLGNTVGSDGQRRTERRNWAASYALHVYASAARKMLDLHEWSHLTIGGLRMRRSNFARAVWPIVHRALEDGILDESQDLVNGEMWDALSHQSHYTIPESEAEKYVKW